MQCLRSKLISEQQWKIIYLVIMQEYFVKFIFDLDFDAKIT